MIQPDNRPTYGQTQAAALTGPRAAHARCPGKR
jgi:hypothetical protein